jgi:hypothetical protein
MNMCKTLTSLFVLVLVSEARLEAYLDPGSGSMLVQLLLGGTAGVAVILKLGWRRLLERFGVGRSKQPANKPDE